MKPKMGSNKLTIKGERKAEYEDKEEDYHRVERYSGTFSRSFTIPGEVDGNKIDATMKDGILNLKIPKSEAKKAKTININ